MAGGVSQYLANKLIATALGQGSATPYTPGSGVFCALDTVISTDAAAGTEVTVAAYSAYARASIGASGGFFPTPTAGTVTNSSSAITFPQCTGGTGASIVGFQLYDAPTGGNPLFWGPCTLAVGSGVTPSFATSGLTISMT